MESQKPWQIWIDTGGTFTDCLALDPQGNTHNVKVLSSSALIATVEDIVDERTLNISIGNALPQDFLIGFTIYRLEDNQEVGTVYGFEAVQSLLSYEAGDAIQLSKGDTITLTSLEEAPLLAVRLVTATPSGDELPKINMRLATTRATNALLEKRGDNVAFFVTKGFKDLLLIGDQTRPDLFALNIKKPKPLYERVVEVHERVNAEGMIIHNLEIEQLKQLAEKCVQDGITVAAVALLHSYTNPAHEELVAHILRDAGFTHVSCSSMLAPLIKILPRAETAVVNSYTSSAIEKYVSKVRKSLKHDSLRIMNSAGGLVDSSIICPKDCLLSGPAGGVVGAAYAAQQSGYKKIIGFDMGGTSTDVCRFDGDYDYRFEHKVGDAHIMAPALAIETVAAGGGSICSYKYGRLNVGPDSAGANPGPACYGAGGPLTLTDVNLLLGRVDAANFSFPVDNTASEKVLLEVVEQVESETGNKPHMEKLLGGFLCIADERMADAIAQISIRQGIDPSDYALVAFGGAGGQHACSVAQHLGINTVIFPNDASLLSATGLGKAAIERIAEKQVLRLLQDVHSRFDQIIEDLKDEAIKSLLIQGILSKDIDIRRIIVNARLYGQESTLQLEVDNADQIEKIFTDEYISIYGHTPENRPIEIESIRLIASTRVTFAKYEERIDSVHTAETDKEAPCYVNGLMCDVSLYSRNELKSGAQISGPALLNDMGATLVIEDGWTGNIDGAGAVILTEHKIITANSELHSQTDLVKHDLFMHRLTAIAVEMGEQLQRTALSTNVKERCDFSCALLDNEGRLLVNAPHIPVHLGALGECVRSVSKAMKLGHGDVIVTNHPGFGGSHLPDVTVITPVFIDDEKLIGYCASRAHHAEIGGTRPGSMPPDATTLIEEGIVITPMYLVKAGTSCFAELETILKQNPNPSRAIRDNLADIRAAMAANRRGENRLIDIVSQYGIETVFDQMQAIQKKASVLASMAISNMQEGKYEATEKLDDGSKICVSVTIKNDSAEIDFTGTSPQHAGNLNATPAIVRSAVIYVLRLIIGEALPLSEGMLQKVSINIPEGSMLSPNFNTELAKAPAVVGGNTETSQRIVDTLLKALGIVAASQGTMNNVLFGNDKFGYYETICGGSGAGPDFDGEDAVHSHMTNTRMTDPEILEHSYPVRLERFNIIGNSGGKGRYAGGRGVGREITFLESLSLSVIAQRRSVGPYGLMGGESGSPGKQCIHRVNGDVIQLNSIDGLDVNPGDRLIINTPGGGGYG